MTFFHYTSREHFDVIVHAGVIFPTESNVGGVLPWEPPYGERVGPDVVWLLDSSDPFAFNHGLAPDRFNGLNKRAIRIEVDVPAIRWLDWEPAQQMHPSWRQTLVDIAGGEEAAEHWYVWPAAIRRSRWVACASTLGGDQP